jgi:uracil phosphoribosyltransferase
MAAPSCDSAAATLSDPAPAKYQNVIILPQTNQLIALLTICRDKNTSRADFIFYANRIIRLLVEEGNASIDSGFRLGLNHLPVVEKEVTTPTGSINSIAATDDRVEISRSYI